MEYQFSRMQAKRYFCKVRHPRGGVDAFARGTAVFDGKHLL